MADYQNILSYWFGDLSDPLDFPVEKSSLWFRKSDEVDAEIRTRFGLILSRAKDGAYDGWAKEARGLLALVVVLDQFSRNIHRGGPSAFAADAKALALAKQAVNQKIDKSLYPVERVFLYLPFEHSEDLNDQKTSVELFTKLVEDVPAQMSRPMQEFLRYAKAHLDIIERFGRFPHRNSILGRDSTPEEIEFLKKPGSSF